MCVCKIIYKLITPSPKYCKDVQLERYGANATAVFGLIPFVFIGSVEFLVALLKKFTFKFKYVTLDWLIALNNSTAAVPI